MNKCRKSLWISLLLILLILNLGTFFHGFFHRHLSETSPKTAPVELHAGGLTEAAFDINCPICHQPNFSGQYLNKSSKITFLAEKTAFFIADCQSITLAKTSRLRTRAPPFFI